MGESASPSFKNPPVIETVMGVQFAPLSDWLIPHFGLFWKLVREDFPTVQVQPPLASPISGGEILLHMRPEARCWYVSEDSAELAQVQHDRFLLNWRSTDKAFPYPRYHERTKPVFLSNWERFQEFLAAEKLSTPNVIQCELTYINHIPKGEGWECAADWGKVFTICGILEGEKFLPQPESRQFSINYLMPDDSGTLNASASRAIRTKDATEIIKFQLSARGRPKPVSEDSVSKWMDVAHDWIVKGFTELTTSQMHARWGREQ